MKVGNFLEYCSRVTISLFAQEEQPQLQRPLTRQAHGEASNATAGAALIAFKIRFRVPIIYRCAVGGDM